MAKKLEFYFDIVSPTAFLAYCRLKQLAEQYELEIVYKPMLLGGVFKATDNTTPIAIPAKGRYMMESDLPRFVRRYGIELNLNPFFPINSIQIQRGALAADKLGCLESYLQAMFTAMWVDGKNLGDMEVAAELMSQAGLDANALVELIQSPDIKSALISNTEEAVSRGAFGAPTMYMDGEMYFGQDRLDFVEEALQAG